MLSYEDFEYELLDSGDKSRIEKFGKHIIKRPCPQVSWNLKVPASPADATFVKNDKEKKWLKNAEIKEPFYIKVGSVIAEIRFSENGQLGIFPEQFDNWRWIQQQVKNNSKRSLKILNTFAYTGMATLFSSAANTEVCHVDGAKSIVKWARRNAEISGLQDAKIRWVCDDVMSFMAREIRRGKQYDGIILDPPAFGRGGKAEWRIKRDLPKLMQLVQQILTPNPIFVILTCHATDLYTAEDMVRMLEKLPQFKGRRAEKLLLKIPSRKGTELTMSFGARIK